MEPLELRRAVRAGRETASELGLEVDDVAVVHNSDRVALRMTPREVLARVAPLGHLPESEFEVEVAVRLAATDAPVAGLDPRVPPGVRVRDAFALSLWTYYEPVTSRTAPADYADALLRQHAALRQVDLKAPHFTDRVAAALQAVTDRARSPHYLLDQPRNGVPGLRDGMTAPPCSSHDLGG
ncbi:aminoglycoside phosphotransferase family protein, partial [Streptomyces sp. NPDC000983]